MISQLQATGFVVQSAEPATTRPIYDRSKQEYVGLARWDPGAARDGVAFLGNGSHWIRCRMPGAYAAYLPHSLGGSGQCSANWMDTGCGFVTRFFESGGADLCGSSGCSLRSTTINITYKDGTRRSISGFSDIPDGNYVWTGDAARAAARGWNMALGVVDDFNTLVKVAMGSAWLYEAGYGRIDGRNNYASNPQNPAPLTGGQIDMLGSNLQKFLDDPECGKYIKTLLGSLPNDVWKTNKFGGSLIDVFNRVKNGGGFWSGDTMPKALARTDPNTMTTTFDRQRSTPLITGQSWQQFGATALLAHELIHVFTNAPNAGVYGHLQMAQAASAAASSLGLNVKEALMLDFPTTRQYGTGDAYDVALSGYHDRVLAYACRKVKL